MDRKATFRNVPPGRYRIFILDAQFQQDVSAYAPRFPDFLKNEVTLVEVSDSGGLTEATATYLTGAAIKEAIRQVGPLDPHATQSKRPDTIG